MYSLQCQEDQLDQDMLPPEDQEHSQRAARKRKGQNYPEAATGKKEGKA